MARGRVSCRAARRGRRSAWRPWCSFCRLVCPFLAPGASGQAAEVERRRAQGNRKVQGGGGGGGGGEQVSRGAPHGQDSDVGGAARAPNTELNRKPLTVRGMVTSRGSRWASAGLQPGHSCASHEHEVDVSTTCRGAMELLGSRARNISRLSFCN